MSTAAKLKSKQADNRARLKSKQEGVGLDDPQQRKNALSNIPARRGSASGVSEEDAPSDTDAQTPERTDAQSHTPDTADDVTKSPGKRVSGKRTSSNSTLSSTVFEVLTERAKPGTAADTKIIASIDASTRALLAQVEKDVFRSTRKRLSRSAVMSEAARRVAANPNAYQEMAGNDFGARIPGEVYADLIEVTNLAEPKLAYGPRVGSAIAELLNDIESHIQAGAPTPERTTEQPHTEISLVDGERVAP